MRKNDITRRDFMKKIGIGTAAFGVSSLAPRFVNLSRAAKRDHILVGRPQSATGPLAAFTEPSPWVDNRALEEINKNGGIFIKDVGKKLPIKVKYADTESNPTKASEVAAKLILKDKVDIMYVSATPINVNPVAAMCERYKMPCIATLLPIELFLAGGPYHWSFNPCASLMDFMAAFMEMWEDVKTNKIIGLVAANDTDGVAWADGAHKGLPKAGYKVIDVGRFPNGHKDFTTMINTWKKEKVEILFGNLDPPDFVTAWRQCHRHGFIPKVCSMSKAILFPSVVEAIGDNLGLGTSTEAIWHPSYGFKSSLTGYKAKDLCEAYEKESGKQWTPPLGGIYLGYEIISDVFSRAQTLDKESIRNAIAETDLNTMWGHVKFNKENVGTLPSGALQWVKGEKYPFDSKLVANGNWKDLPTDGKLMSVSELQK